MFSKSILGLTVVILVGFLFFFFIGESQDYKDINVSAIVTNQNSEPQEESFPDQIENFSTQEFDKNYHLSRLIEADSYINYQDKPGLMKNPKVTSFGETSDIVD